MPFDRKRYPADWPAISKRIRERDDNRCKSCGVKNGVYRITDQLGEEYTTDDLMRVEVATCVDGAKSARIVLTVAHLYDPDPMNCADGNLAALCQRCHNRWDGRSRARNAAETRRKKKGSVQPELFGVAS